ncbi:arf-GAP with GTPase, ANK repeat and PH domain-containing protein 1-like [Styela clava]
MSSTTAHDIQYMQTGREDSVGTEMKPLNDESTQNFSQIIDPPRKPVATGRKYSFESSDDDILTSDDDADYHLSSTTSSDDETIASGGLSSSTDLTVNKNLTNIASSTNKNNDVINKSSLLKLPSTPRNQLQQKSNPTRSSFMDVVNEIYDETTDIPAQNRLGPKPWLMRRTLLPKPKGNYQVSDIDFGFRPKQQHTVKATPKQEPKSPVNQPTIPDTVTKLTPVTKPDSAPAPSTNQQPSQTIDEPLYSVPTSRGRISSGSTRNVISDNEKPTKYPSETDIGFVSIYFEFHLVSMDGNIWYFSCPTSYERDQWVLVIEQQIMNVLQNGASSKNKTDCTMMTPVDMEVFRSIPGNDTCVDCDCPNPTWASLNLGCMMCIQCSGIHRNLGSHVSRVRSIELDDWPIECSAVMKQVGNRVCNSVYEANVGRFIKPTPHSTREEREVFIRDKYIHKKFVSSLPAECDVGATICEAISSANMRLLVQMLSHATPSDINAPATRDHRAALHIAAYHGDLAMLQLLLWNKADVRQRTATGETAAMITEHRGHQECHRVLSSSVPHDRLSVLHDQANNSPASLTSSASSLSIATLPSENALIPAVNHDHGYYSNEMNTRPNINYMYTSAI